MSRPDTLAMPSSEKTRAIVTIRMMDNADLPALQVLSPPGVKPVIEFFVYPTLVAVVDGEIAGYTQFSLGPDKVLHSLAIRIGARWKGHGIGQQLMDAKVDLAKRAGATMRFYAVARDGEEALKKILVKQGMHCCQKQGAIWIYATALTEEDAPHA